MKKILFLFTMCIITCKVFGQYPLYIEAQNKADMYGTPIICDSLGKPINLKILLIRLSDSVLRDIFLFNVN